jgi:hypothetical protein
MRSKLAIVCWISLSVISGCKVSTYQAVERSQEYPSESLHLKGVPGLAGAVPTAMVLGAAKAAGVVTRAPRHLWADLKTPVALSNKDDWAAILRKIEYVHSLVYDPVERALYPATATHGVDAPDDAGRATADDPLSLARRQMVSLKFRFQRVGGNAVVSEDAIGAGANGSRIEFAASLPAGVQRNWEIATERSYFDRVTDTESGRTFDTDRQTESAGVQFDGMASRLPGGFFRLQANLSVSAFERGLDRSVVTVPLDLDGWRGEWVKVFQFQTVSAGLRASFKGMGLNLNAGGDQVAVYARVD